jgi:hypothetical protein
MSNIIIRPNGWKEDSVGMKGYVELVLTDKNGNVIAEREGSNLITTSGRQHIAAKLSGLYTTSNAVTMGWMEVGTSTQTAAAADTLLITPVGASRVVATPTIVSGNVVSDSVSYAATFPAGTGTGALTEAGIFNVVTANTVFMLNRIVYAVINKGVNDTLTVAWKVTIA